MKRSLRLIQSIAGAVILCALWEVLGQTKVLGPSLPALSTVLGTLFAPNRAKLFTTAISATALSAALGLLIGGGSGALIAGARQTISWTRPGLDRFAALIHAIPQVAIAPVMVIVFGRAGSPIAVAAIAAFFPAYAASTRAFAAAAQSHQDLFTVLGSSRSARLLRLDLPAALPGLADALKLAAPGAVLGAVLGEWFGAPKGVGILILSSSQNYDIPLLWAGALVSTLMALVGFGVFAAVQNAATRRLT
ncbi:ABC transporter permease [Arthrobacter sp. B2a2-09]|uniref:ABC transporter permease n=1 Tax=Arthrobacter sp. B2a2-09 TaxID=2952822 RepID=UPI0022CD3CD3|nr:ABC transporter permease subunit [Arthrobacter sp. B2a2-09]MCZ9884927.1 ABC transporter permease subunit [Arthrobacter sp. B2a2-09]